MHWAKIDSVNCFFTSLEFPVTKQSFVSPQKNQDFILEEDYAMKTNVETCYVLAYFIYSCFEIIHNYGLKERHILDWAGSVERWHLE